MDKMVVFTWRMALTAMCLVVCSVCGAAAQGDSDLQADQERFMHSLKTHLRALSERDIEMLKTTLPPDDGFFSINQGAAMTTSKAAYLRGHEAWFKEKAWTFETKIVHTLIGKDVGIAIVDAIYREPVRNGKPYFNKMTVSFALKKFEQQWLVVQEHTSTVEKSKE